MRIQIGEQSEAALYRILVLAPNAKGLDDLNHMGAGSELDRLSKLVKMRAVALVGDFGSEDISDELLNYDYDIVHCAAHGTEDGFMLSAEHDGQRFVSGQYFADLLSQHQVGIVLLMACHSADYAKQIADAGVEWVFSTRGADLSNESVRVFAGEFYKHLLRHNDPERAYDYALSRLEQEQDRACFQKNRASETGRQAMRRTVERLFVRLDEVQAAVEKLGQRMTDMERGLKAQNREAIRAILTLAGAMSNGSKDIES